MRSRFPTLAVLATLALGFGLTAPAGGAAAMSAPGAARAALAADAAPAAVEQVQYYRDRGRNWHRNRDWRGRDWRRSHRNWDRGWSQNRRYHRPRSGIYFHFGTPAPRYYVPAPRRHYGLSQAHVNWCYSRYRSYRAWDNTFQPYHGPRRQCRSPYA